MPTFRWWIDEPLIRGSANPSDRDLQALRADGFTIAVSLLEESKQPPKYKQESALTAGWSIHSIPIEEGAAPSLEQIRKFMTLLESLPAQTKVLVFCESGQGRTAFMGAAYWVNKRLSASDAIVRMSKACATSEWATQSDNAFSVNTRGSWGANKRRRTSMSNYQLVGVDQMEATKLRSDLGLLQFDDLLKFSGRYTFTD
jgi:protein tyrosine phosphatase (PTP) superfamily phosphohydrolase (DUF442 family)